MSYEVTAIRKRPQTFDQLVGQDFIVTTLKNSIEQKRIAHAYLFSGPRGVGKTSAARILAKSLNCEGGPTSNPCSDCTICKEITSGNSLDVIEIDGASHTSVNDVREIKDEVLFSPNNSRYKIYIIDEVHMLSNSAFNALLKTIEEPPPYIIFIFATTEVHKVPATIRSRCQQFNFRLISASEIKDKLREAAQELNTQADDSALLWIAKEATGSLRDAYTLFDQVISFSDNKITLEKIQQKLGIVGIDELNKLIGLIGKKQTQQAFVYLDSIFARGVYLEQFIIDLTEYFRNLLFLKLDIKKDSILGYTPDQYAREILNTYTLAQIEKALELLLNLYRNMRFSLNQRFELELFITRLSQLPELILPSEILSKIKVLKQEIKTSHAVTDSVDKTKKQDNKTIDEINDEIIKRVINTISKKKHMLAASLEKAVSYILDGNELIFYFKAKDKFSSDQILENKNLINETLSDFLSRPIKIKIELLKNKNTEKKNDECEDIIKKVFRGKTIKGDGNGNQSI